MIASPSNTIRVIPPITKLLRPSGSLTEVGGDTCGSAITCFTGAAVYASFSSDSRVVVISIVQSLQALCEMRFQFCLGARLSASGRVVNQREDTRHEDERGHSRTDQSSNNGTPQ